MAYRQDYILRMIEMMGDFIMALMGKIKKKDFEQADVMINNAYQDMLKEDAAFFDKIPLEELTKSLMEEHNYTHGHLEILSDLLYAQGELNFAQNKKDRSLVYYQKSRYLLDFVLKETKTFSFEKQNRLSEIEGRIDSLEN